MSRSLIRRPSGFLWVVISTLAFFGLVDACALTFQYVEGDDSRAVAYALLGVGTPLYEPMHYHSMTLLLLSLLPNEEAIVRTFAIAGSAIGAVTYLLLTARVAWHWAAQAGIPPKLTTGVLILMPLTIPDFAFLGLVFEPVLVGMSILLLAHLIVRPAFTGGQHSAWRMVASAVLFGFGVSLRWDVGFYGSLIAMDLLLIGWKHHKPALLFAKTTLWGVSALGATLIALALSGYAPSSILETYEFARALAASTPPLKERLADGVTFLTPAMCMLTLVGLGIVVLSFRQCWTVGALLLASSPLFIVVGNPSFCGKAFLTVMPAWFLLMLHGASGLQQVSQRLSKASRRGMVAALALIVLTPWVVGIQWNPPGSVRGPGFFFSPTGNADSAELPRPVFAGGLGIPTPEGPRPLWGFGHVLFGGEWRAFVRSMNDDWNDAIDLAIANQLPIHQDSDTGIVMCRLMSRGYTLVTERAQLEVKGDIHYVHHRNYTHSQSGNPLEALFISNIDRFNDAGQLPEILENLNHEEIVIVYAFPSRLDQLANSSTKITTLSPLTAVWKRQPSAD